VGQTCMLKTGLEIPALVDEMDNAVDQAYNGSPERLLLVGRDGKIVFKSGPGPMLFVPREWDQAIDDYLKGQRAA